MILLRHGQSEFNRLFHATGRDPGIPDAPLTPLGEAQAAAAAEALAGEDIRRILCSPYTRALQTAAPVARRLGLPVTVTPAVRERYSASCDIGSGRAALALAWPALDLSGIEEVWWPPVEEPHAQFEARCALFRAEMAALPDRAHTLVVCHWGVIRALTGRDAGNGEWLRLP
ncbi:histidine phosphatase family protein [Paracraurococcus lichenis]|uniref:Histidine phosphatase family protein n=1 Tax=Paracraurococcus lichenis TaxID=3064888 RepID=A0ABT9E767_9PROT|nr:histidine phosphatase family protein [Paracraurococcus sp. LOR1-02]MDO9712008.1 histidine phosphatase family protein [Paracraurococcus sp. LOR1-02]